MRNREWAEHFERVHGDQLQGDLQASGKCLRGENSAPPGDRHDAFRQHLHGTYADGYGRSGNWIGTMWNYSVQVSRSACQVDDPISKVWTCFIRGHTANHRLFIPVPLASSHFPRPQD